MAEAFLWSRRPVSSPGFVVVPSAAETGHVRTTTPPKRRPHAGAAVGRMPTP